MILVDPWIVKQYSALKTVHISNKVAKNLHMIHVNLNFL